MVEKKVVVQISLIFLEIFESSGRVPILGGSKSAILGQMSVGRLVFLIRFYVGCVRNCTATEKTCV